MTWKDIIKVDVIADSQKAIDVIGTQRENLDMIDEAVRKFANGEELDLAEMENLDKSHISNTVKIKQVMVTLIKKIEGA